MENLIETLDTEILGNKIRFTSSDAKEQAIAKKAARIVRDQAIKIKEKSPHLSDTEISVLVALRFAGQHLAMEDEYRDNIQVLQETAEDALKIIDQITTKPVQ